MDSLHQKKNFYYREQNDEMKLDITKINNVIFSKYVYPTNG